MTASFVKSKPLVSFRRHATKLVQLRSTKLQGSPMDPLIAQTRRAHSGLGPRGSYMCPLTGSRTGGGGGGVGSGVGVALGFGPGLADGEGAGLGVGSSIGS